MNVEFMNEHQFEIENRMKNLLWTVSGDYSLNAKMDVHAFEQSRYIAVYDAVKEGAFARYFDKEALGLYMVKKVYLQGIEAPLKMIAQICIDEAVGELIATERLGVAQVRRKAYEDVLNIEFSHLSSTQIGQLKLALMRKYLDNNYRTTHHLMKCVEAVEELHGQVDTRKIIEVIDRLYNELYDSGFEKEHGSLEQVLAVTVEELTEFTWQDYLTEEMYEDALAGYLEKMSADMVSTVTAETKEEEKKQRQTRKKITVIDQETLDKMYSYVELNYGRTYLGELEEKRLNHQNCRGIHGDCSLYFTDGILNSSVKRNYQYEYARKQKEKNLYLYHDKHRVVKKNINSLADTLKKSLVLRNETLEVLSDSGTILPSRVWRIGRSTDNKLFKREFKASNSDFVVDVLLDASGSQRSRQEQVALQGYMISEALSRAGIPHRVMSFCTFWDYTILHRFREYEDDASANARIFEYMTTSNNRDGLAIKAVGQGLLAREEDNKILILLSDGRPYDVIINRPNARNPQPYDGDYALRDTATEVRKLRNQGVRVLGVFHGDEKDLSSEKKIFGKDFAFIRNLENFSKIVGRYLMKQLEDEES